MHSISGPKCRESDCFWQCDECFSHMQYDFSGYYVCRCRLAPAKEFEYWCKNIEKHGENYVKYPEDELNKQLNSLRSFNDRVILVCLHQKNSTS
jgi:hypothetical protein